MREDIHENLDVFPRFLAKWMRWFGGRKSKHSWIVWALPGLIVIYLACIALFGTGPVGNCGNDTLIFLNGAWRILNGQIPHRDFYLALGPLEYMIMAAGLLITRGTPQGLSVGIALSGVIAAFWGWWIAQSRMGTIPAILVASWIAVTATAPAPLGMPAWVSCAMAYNRLGYALLGVLLVECAFVREHAHFRGGFSSGVIAILLLFLKLSFFGAAALFLLGTFPLRRADGRRWLGILAGAAASLAAFSAYLHFALPAFVNDMLLAIDSRGSRLSWIRIVGRLPGISEIAIVFTLTVLASFLAGRGKFWSGRGLVTLLLGCSTIVASAVLTATNARESDFRMTSFWLFVLAAQLAEVYPGTKEKTAVAVLALVGIGGVVSQFYLDYYSMTVLLRYRLTRVWSTGAVIPGSGVDMLRFFDGPSLGGDNGRLYVTDVTDGLHLLESHSAPGETVATIGFHDPFTYLERRKPALGGSTWLLLGNNISRAHLPPAQRVFGDADLIMEPHYESSHYESDQLIEQAYQGYLTEHYSLVAQSASWMLYRRKQ